MNCSQPGSFVLGISQARILKWVAISFSGDLPDPGVEPKSPALQAVSLPLSHQGLNGVRNFKKKYKGKLCWETFLSIYTYSLLLQIQI